MKATVAIYPGSFDPIHQGHIEVIKKAQKIFSKVLIVVTTNPAKIYNSSIDERFENVSKALKNLNIQVVKNEHSLTAKFALTVNAEFIIRGVRNTTDYNYEYEMAKANKILNSNLETIFFFAEEEDRELSSSMIKEINSYECIK